MASLSAWIRSPRLTVILAVLLCGMWKSRTRSGSFAFLLQFCLGRAVLRSGERSCASWSSGSSSDQRRLASLGLSRERVRFVFPDSVWPGPGAFYRPFPVCSFRGGNLLRRSRPPASSSLHQRLPGLCLYKLVGFNKFAPLRQRPRGGNKLCLRRAANGCRRKKTSATPGTWMDFSISVKVFL